MSLEDAQALDHEDLSEALGCLPTRKAHAAMLAVSTLHKALERYRGP